MPAWCSSPILVRRVETTDGEVLFEAKQEPQPAVSEETAFLMSNMMADVINAGTGAPARSVGFRLPAAGKTGTTNDYHDAWFVGFTPRLATGVWIGYDQPRTIIGGGYASVLAVPVWGRFMAAATRKDKPEWFSAPSHGDLGDDLPVEREARDRLLPRARARGTRVGARSGRWCTPNTSCTARNPPSRVRSIDGSSRRR